MKEIEIEKKFLITPEQARMLTADVAPIDMIDYYIPNGKTTHAVASPQER